MARWATKLDEYIGRVASSSTFVFTFVTATMFDEKCVLRGPSTWLSLGEKNSYPPYPTQELDKIFSGVKATINHS